MPDLKYRIKRASEQKQSVYEYDTLPPGVLDAMKEAGTFIDSDKNIKPHTCTFIQRYHWDNNDYYLCNIRIRSKRTDLISSDMKNQPRENLEYRLETLKAARDYAEQHKSSDIQAIEDTYNPKINEASKQNMMSVVRALEVKRDSEINDINTQIVEYDTLIKNLEIQLDSLSGSMQPEGEGEYRVSGALKLNKESFRVYDSYEEKYIYPEFSIMCFECKHCDIHNGKSAYSESGFSERNIQYPKCNCYTPRGGMTVTHYSGALKTSEAPGYWAERDILTAYDQWKKGPSADYLGTIPSVVPAVDEKYPENPNQLGFIYMVLNARAIVASCCWWAAESVLVYKKEYFRAIDLAVAKAKALTDAGLQAPQMSASLGVSSAAEYIYREGDYPFDGIGDEAGEEAIKRVLLGRNYDWTLPETGNNTRIIYALDSKVTGDLTKSIRDEDKENCAEFQGMWHFDNPLWFSPKNCAHPDCKVKYEWGAICNGGGAFSLADGRACPYYESSVLGPESESKKLCRMGRMYAGDYVTGGAILELMWLAKGGLPWTQEEWESTWRVPYIWTTMPFNPITVLIDEMRDKYGNMEKVSLRKDYRLYGQKTNINLITGSISDSQPPPVLLPGGTVTAHNRSPEGEVSKADRVPDFPTFIKQLEVRSMGSIRIIWPNTDLNSVLLSYEHSEDYIDQLREASSKSYKKIIWDMNGLNTNVIVQGSIGSFKNGLYCINTSFLSGAWAEKRFDLEAELLNLNKLEPKTQYLLKDLWQALIMSQLPDKSPILSGAPLLRTYMNSKGMFIFENVKLNCRSAENFIMVFGYTAEGVIDSAFIKVTPVFRRSYAYQSEAELMTSWKTVWNGRPSLFFNMQSLYNIGGEKSDPETEIRSETIAISDYNDKTISIRDLTTKIAALEKEIAGLENEIKALVSEIATLTGASALINKAEERRNAVARLTAILTQKKNELQDARNALALRQEAAATTEEQTESELSTIDKRIESIDKDIEDLETSYYNRKNTQGPDADTSDIEADIKSKREEKENLLNRQAELEAEEADQEDTDDEEAAEDDESQDYLDLDFPPGDPDNQELMSDEDGNVEKPDYDTVTRLYVPFMNSNENTWRNIDAYKRIDGHTGGGPAESITLEIPQDSGVTTWKYLNVSQPMNYSFDVFAQYTFTSKAAKRVVVYSTRESDISSGNNLGVPLTDDIGKWYALSTCSSMIILVMNPDIFNNHTEAMIFSLSAKAIYKWKNQQGEETEIEKVIKFVPMHYCQVERSFPGYTDGKDATLIGTKSAHGTTVARVEISEDIEIIERPNIGRHPWIYFATPVTEETDVKEWHNYNNIWYPEIPDSEPTILPHPDNVELYIEFAYIAEIYDHNDRNMTEWETDEASTAIAFNHPKAGIQRTIFYHESIDEEGIDGYTTVPIGSHDMATLWPYARYASRDYEIKYIWRDEMKNVQKADHPRRGANKTCGGPAKRFTSYAIGDHDLGTEFQQAVTYKERADKYDSLSFTEREGLKLSGKNPIDGFPTDAGKPFAAGEKRGSSYYPYTRSEPYTVFVPQNKDYIWDFMLMWRNKYRPEKDSTTPPLGKGRMLAPKYCQLDTGNPLNRGASDWYRYWEYNPKDKPTQYLGKSLTRGPVFQLEYREYFDVDNKMVYLRPYVARSNYTRNAQWMVLLDKLVPEDYELESGTIQWAEDYEPAAGEIGHDKWEEYVKNNHRAWSVRKKYPAFYGHYGKASYGQYVDELNRLHDYGLRRGWAFTFPLDPDKLEFWTINIDDDDKKKCCEQDDDICKKNNPSYPICGDCTKTDAELKEIPGLEQTLSSLRNKLNAKEPPLIWTELQAIRTQIYNAEARLAWLKCQEIPKPPYNPDEVDYGTWTTVVINLYNYWKDSGKGYDDLMIEVTRGRSYGWQVIIEPELRFSKTTESEDVAYEECMKQFNAAMDLTLRTEQKVKATTDEITALEAAQERYPTESILTIEKIARLKSILKDQKALYYKYLDDWDKIDCQEPLGDTEVSETYVAKINTDMTTGCTRKDVAVRNIDESGSFMILDNYVPSSITSEAEMDKRADEQKSVYRKLQTTSQRYYRYEQKPFGYNYPWSPYDSPPLFGNTGRELFVLELCTIGSIISWLPPDEQDSDTTSSTTLSEYTGLTDVTDDPDVEPEEPPDPAVEISTSTATSAPATTPSWWTGWRPEGQAKEMVTLLAPPYECSRAIEPLSSEAYNPFYNYIFNNSIWGEIAPDFIEDPSAYMRPPDVRIITKYDISHYGEPYYRSDLGRFTLVPDEESGMSSVRVLGETASYRNSCYENLIEEEEEIEFEEVTTSGTEEGEKQPCDETNPDYPDCYEDLCDDGSMPPCDEPCDENHPDYPDCDDTLESEKDAAAEGNNIKAEDIKGLPFKDGEEISVGLRYPGFCGPYNYGKFFVGYKLQYRSYPDSGEYSFYPHWAWPIDNKDIVERGVSTVKWWMGATTSSGKSIESVNREGSSLASISDIYAGPYLRKQKVNDDGREISCGPELTDSKDQHPKEAEKSYQDAYYAIIVESERMFDNSLRAPLIWAKKIDNPSLTNPLGFKVPEATYPAHQVQTDGTLIPCRIGAGDENKTDKFNNVNFSDIFSTGKPELLDDKTQDSSLPNLLTSYDKNEAGVFPGFRIPYVNYRLLGKVFSNTEYDISKIRLDRKAGYYGSHNHVIVAEIYLKQFEADAIFLDLDFVSFFSENLTSTYFTSAVDKMAVQVSVIGTPADPTVTAGKTISKVFVRQMPLDTNVDSKKEGNTGRLTFDMDFVITKDLKIIIELFVQTEINNFLYNKKSPWGVDKPDKTTDPLDEVYLDALLDKLSIGTLLPGKCAEIVRVREIGFIISGGNGCSVKEETYNFFDEAKSEWFISKWEEDDKQVNRNYGWWTEWVGGEALEQDPTTLEKNHGKRGSSLEGIPVRTEDAENKKYVTGYMNDKIRQTDESFNKTVKAKAYPDRCLEIPELQQSRLKIEAWNNMNKGSEDGDGTEDTNLHPAERWTYGGIWTTRMAGPEWMSSDPNPTRDLIWWPALPYYTGDIILKGRYFKFDEQYKDEAKVMGESKLPDPDDEFNIHANNYELRGFDALLRVIEEWETKTSEERKTAFYKGNESITMPGREMRESNPMVDAIRQGAGVGNLSATRPYAGTSWAGSDRYIGGATLQGAMAASAVQGILNSMTRNYVVFDRREYVYIDEVGISPTLKSWKELQKKEVIQKALFEKAQQLLPEDVENSVSLTAIVPYHDWEELMKISGKELNIGNQSFDYEPLNASDLSQIKGYFTAKWKKWAWEEIASFTFRNEESDQIKFPTRNTDASDWSQILARECGQRWTHDKYDEGQVIQEDCEDVSSIGKAGKCSESEMKWTKTSLGWSSDREAGGEATKWPPTVSKDAGITLLQPDPWWRY